MSSFNEGYAEQLRDNYPRYIANQVVDSPSIAQVSADVESGVPYVTVSTANPDDPYAFFVPGFGEGIVNKASFACELGKQNLGVILPGQNRKGSQGDAIDLQADNYLAVLKELPESALPSVFISHSFGAQILERMVYKSPEFFEDSQIILLAPSGSIPNETYPKLGWRWIKFMISEASSKRHMEFPDPDNVTGTASAKTLLSNPIRTAKEMRALKQHQIDYPTLRKHVGSLSVISYGEDAMYPSGKMVNHFAEVMSEPGQEIIWVSSFSPEFNDKGEQIGADGAVHDDEQFNPSRVVGTIKEVLGYNSKRPN